MDKERSKRPVTQEPKYGKVISAVDTLSLGFSMVLAVLIGIGVGIGLKKLSGWEWILWLGVFWGVAAACYNIYLAYKKQQKAMDELQNDPKYREYHKLED
ncbi:AtpZ/AtpI family protein [Helicobacter pametensis]|uniref:AtpZ/AtpI family protein n=1 Tax=Helicobacter pametensis TaxID=95149 RepID=UPI0004BAA4D4|nr:AtpZ/AtpI family protein [Helicobacter pametensis]